jgi:exonuclease SbcC
MKINKLTLRGAIGIKKGLGLDEVEIDFTQFKPGLIALTGRNGSGKTTIMENLHPFRTMVSRDGSLQQHFFLKDSHRIIDYEHNGLYYQSAIFIDALTGASEAYLFQFLYDSGAPDNVNKKALNDGKVSTYDIELEKILGSPDLFFNSVFSGQKSKGIAELKTGERRKLFYELLNLNVYEVYLEEAKAELKKYELQLAEIEGQLKDQGFLVGLMEGYFERKEDTAG